MKKQFLTITFFLAVLLSYSQNTTKYIISSASAKLRSGAGIEFEIINELQKDEQVTVIEKNKNGWWLINYAGEQGVCSPKIDYSKVDYFFLKIVVVVKMLICCKLRMSFQ